MFVNIIGYCALLLINGCSKHLKYLNFVSHFSVKQICLIYFFCTIINTRKSFCYIIIPKMLLHVYDYDEENIHNAE